MKYKEHNYQQVAFTAAVENRKVPFRLLRQNSKADLRFFSSQTVTSL